MAGALTNAERYRTNKQDLDWTEEQAYYNVGEAERMVSGLAGGALLLTGLARRSWLGAAMAIGGVVLLHRGITGHCVIYANLGANTSTLGLRKIRTSRAIKVTQAIRINRPPDALYRFWRNLENLPRVMSHLQSVEAISDRLSHWIMKAPAVGMPVMEWDAEIVNEIENELIGWRSLRGADVQNAGSVRFKRANGRSTEIIVTLQYDPPAGPIGAGMAALLGNDVQQMIREDLERFKEAMESGQIGEGGTMGIQNQQTADAVEMLKKDHEEVMKLFERFEGASVDEKGGLAQHIYRELEVHATLEEEIFYPSVRDQVDLKTVLEGEDKGTDEDESQDTEDIIAISYEEHKTVKELIAQLRQLNPTSDEFKERFAEMKEAVQDHAGEEEETIFPAAQMQLDLEKLGEQMRQRKEHLTSSKVA
jgi:uncharacterized membrane protein/hemerythrin superfamily protein